MLCILVVVLPSIDLHYQTDNIQHNNTTKGQICYPLCLFSIESQYLQNSFICFQGAPPTRGNPKFNIHLGNLNNLMLAKEECIGEDEKISNKQSSMTFWS